MVYLYFLIIYHYVLFLFNFEQYINFKVRLIIKPMLDIIKIIII